MIFSDEYLCYDPLNDRLVIQVFSQGTFGPYYLLSETETYYPSPFVCPPDWMLSLEIIDTLQLRDRILGDIT